MCDHAVSGDSSRRVRFYSLNDLSLGSNYDRAKDVLSSLDEHEEMGVLDAIELYECFLLIDAGCRPSEESDESYRTLLAASKRAKGLAYRTMRHHLERDGFGQILQVAESCHGYGTRAWTLLGKCDACSIVTAKEFVAALEAKLWRIVDACRAVWPSHEFPNELRDALVRHPEVSAEPIISFCAVRLTGPKESFRLPDVLTNDDVCGIVKSYVSSDDANLNYVRAADSWPSNCRYSLSNKTRSHIRKRCRALTDELFAQGSSVLFGMEVRFDPEQRECVSVRIAGRNVCYSYGMEWLEKTADNPSILNNLIYVFHFVDENHLIATQSNGRYESVFMSMLMHPKTEYTQTLQSQMEQSRVLASLQGYQLFLLKHGKSIESVIGWYFNTYVLEHLGIEGFRICMPSDATSFREKCKLVSSEIERVLKLFTLYVEDGYIDQDRYIFETFGGFGNVPSLLPTKYVRGKGRDYETETHLLFSDQSMVHVASVGEDGSCFFKQVSMNVIHNSAMPAWGRPGVDYLLEHHCVCVEDDVIRPTEKIGGLKAVWDNGSFPMRAAPESHGLKMVRVAVPWNPDRIALVVSPPTRETLNHIVAEGEFEEYSALFSDREAEYLSYVYDKRCFSESAMALRDKYAHASDTSEDPNDKEAQGDYLLLLYVLLCVLLKINDELVVHKGIELNTEFEDWPLAGISKETSC